MTVEELRYSMERTKQHHADAYPAIVCAGDLAALARVALAARAMREWNATKTIMPSVLSWETTIGELDAALATLFDQGDT